MPTFEFSSPEGKKYNVEGPEGATAEQAWDVLQAQELAAEKGMKFEPLTKTRGEYISEIPGNVAEALRPMTSGAPSEQARKDFRNWQEDQLKATGYAPFAPWENRGNPVLGAAELGALLPFGWAGAGAKALATGAAKVLPAMAKAAPGFWQRGGQGLKSIEILVNEGKSLNEIADAHGVTPSQITQVMKREGLNRPFVSNWAKKRIDKQGEEDILSMRERGMNNVDIARSLGVSPSAISQKFDRMKSRYPDLKTEAIPRAPEMGVTPKISEWETDPVTGVRSRRMGGDTMKRDVLERGRSGRPIATAPLATGTEDAILQLGFDMSVPDYSAYQYRNTLATQNRYKAWTQDRSKWEDFFNPEHPDHGLWKNAVPAVRNYNTGEMYVGKKGEHFEHDDVIRRVAGESGYNSKGNDMMNNKDGWEHGYYNTKTGEWVSPSQTGLTVASLQPDFAKNARLRKAGIYPLERDVEERGRSGRPTKTSPLAIGTENDILQRGFDKNAVFAYHASPHDFEKFDLSKMGTGQGAQSYGAGHYLAESPEVSGRGGAYDEHFSSKLQRDLNPQQRIAGAIIGQHRGDREAAYNDAIDAARTYSGTASNNYYEAAELIKSGWEPPKAKIYETVVKEPPDRFLDYDKTLGEQPDNIQKVLRPIVAQIMTDPNAAGYLTSLHGGKTQDDILIGHILDAAKQAQSFRSNLKFAPNYVENALREAGIPGIKYLDEKSRNAGSSIKQLKEGRARIQEMIDNPAIERERVEALKKHLAGLDQFIANHKETRNFVVFDDKTIDVLKKYGIAGPLGAGGAAAALKPDSEQ